MASPGCSRRLCGLTEPPAGRRVPLTHCAMLMDCLAPGIARVGACEEGRVESGAPARLTPGLRHEAELIIRCCDQRSDSNGRARLEALVAAEPDWPYIVATARRHGLLALLYRSLTTMCPARVPTDTLE